MAQSQIHGDSIRLWIPACQGDPVQPAILSAAEIARVSETPFLCAGMAEKALLIEKMKQDRGDETWQIT